jgi:hypothetical protein
MYHWDVGNNNNVQAILGKVKVKLFLCLTTYALSREDVWGSGCIDPRFLDLGTSWRRVITSRPDRYTSGERDTGTHWVGPREVWTTW